LQDAFDLCRKILLKSPEDKDILKLGGVAAFRLGDEKRAEMLLQGAARIDPKDAEVQYNLGVTLQAVGKGAEAEKSFSAALDADPMRVDAANNLGVVRQKSGRLIEALEAYDVALSIDKDYISAHSNKGSVLRLLGRREEAEASLRKTLEMDPENIEAHNNLGCLLHDMGRLKDAELVLRRALHLDPSHIEARNNLGGTLYKLDFLDQAENCLRAVLEKQFDHAGALNNLATLCRAKGKFDEAAELWRRALKANPNMGEVYLSLAALDKDALGDGDVAAMDALSSKPDINDFQAANLCFALARVVEKSGDKKRAFTYLERANRHRKKTVPYDIELDLNYMRKLAETFDASLMKEKAGRGHHSDAPIFIIGMPRSGTSLVEQILASHSTVFGRGERKEMGRVAQNITMVPENADFPKTVRKLNRRTLRSLGRAYVESVRNGIEGLRGVGKAAVFNFTDKMPINFLFLGLIRMILPQARIIHCLRDPMDTCFSCYQQLFTGHIPFAYDLSDLGRFYGGYTRLMDHWRDVLGERFYEVRYEDLVSDQEGETRKLLDFCHLDWEEECLSFYDTPRPVFTASVTQVRKPLYSSSIGRWKDYQENLAPLRAALNKAGV
jgi:tetratricopeptide (TPR) repeat protein